MPPIPVIGRDEANVVRLRPALRDFLRRRVTRQVRRESRPQIELLRGLLQSIRGQGDEQVAQVQAQVGAASDIAGDVDLSGLHGLERRQVKEDMAARQASYQQAIPLLTQGVREQTATDVQAAREALLTAKAERATNIETGLTSALKEARTEGLQTREANAKAAAKARHQRQDRRAAERKLQAAGGGPRAQLKAALRRVENIVITGPADGPWAIPETEADWRKVEMAVETGEGIKTPAATRAVEEARRFIEAMREAGMDDKEIQQRLEGSGLFPFDNPPG